MKSDVEIARSIKLEPITEIAKKINLDTNELEPYGHYMAKVASPKADKPSSKKGKLILVTAITPTKSGIGKTTVSVGLALGLNRIGKKSIVALREPSLGPCFGMKGGAAGGGYAQVLPMEKINLHFTGDFHAITSAHNTISALLDNYIFQNRKNPEALPITKVVWKRVLDVNDRSLRQVITGVGGEMNGITSESGFDITPASELMAILCLARDEADLRRRIENILLAYTADGKPFYLKELGIAGAIVTLLLDAIKPNLVQTSEHTPAIIHGGPFANIAHGCSSVLATRFAMDYADYAITEAGFGADLGAEKFFNIKCRSAELNPDLTVLVVTIGALKMHGGVDEKTLKEENTEGVRKGLENLKRHIDNLEGFGQTVVVAFNKFATDTEAEIDILRAYCKERGIGFALNNAFMQGGEGAVELAQLVVDTIEEKPSQALRHTYELTASVQEKAQAIASKIYGAKEIIFSAKAKKVLKQIEEFNWTNMPICIAKTQYSFSQDPKAYGSARDFTLEVQDIVVNTGSEMIVLILGNVMRMPGLSKSPQALRIDVVDGQITGLS